MAESKGSSNGTIPGGKPKIRKKTREPRPRSPKKVAVAATAAIDIEQELDELDQNVSVRVRERDPDSPPEHRPRSRLGALLRDPSPSAIKESIKRPLSGIFKRPGSRGSSRERPKGKPAEDKEDNMDMALEENGALFTAATQPPATKKKLSLFGDGNRPATAFGRRFSFGRKKKNKDENVEGGGAGGDFEEDDLTLELEKNGVPKRKGMLVELPDSSTTAKEPERNSDSPIIPSLDEIEGAAFGTMHQVAQAPSVAVNRVATYRELDNELMKQAAFATLEDIDLSLLTKFLCPESEVRDENVPWTWDYLYTSICSELRTEWEEEEENSDEEYMIGGSEQTQSAENHKKTEHFSSQSRLIGSANPRRST